MTEVEIKEIDNLIDGFCRFGCKYWENYFGNNKDPDIAFDKLNENVCDGMCPLNKYIKRKWLEYYGGKE